MNTVNEKTVKTVKSNENIKKGEDITEYILPSISKKYVESIQKIIKEGNTYIIYFNKDYTALGQKSRKCKDVPGIKWYSKISTLEKQNGYKEDEWIKWLNDNKIIWDGKNIPEYFWTQEQYNKYNKVKTEEGK